MVRATIADAGDARFDSLLLLVAGSLRLAEPPTARAGGPYGMVSKKLDAVTGLFCSCCLIAA